MSATNGSRATAGLDVSSGALARPLWFLGKGGSPIPASAWRARDRPDWYAFEGDQSWTPLDPSMPFDQICDREGWVIAHLTPRKLRS
jgi:hypothetical protein